MATYYLDCVNKDANHWFTTREELWSWLVWLFDSGKPFGRFQPASLGTRTEPAQRALALAYGIYETAPEITATTDPVAWARECLHFACMAGAFDNLSPEPIVLRWLVRHVKNHARIEVEDLQALALEAAGGAL